MLDAAAVLFEVAGHGGRRLGADEDDGDPAGVEGDDAGDIAAGQVGAVEPERTRERSDGSGEIVDGHHEVIDTGRDGVETRSDSVGFGDLVRCGIGPVTGDLDAVGLGEQHPEQLLGEVGVDPGVDGELPSRRHDVTNPSWLDDCGTGAALHLGDLLAHGEPGSDDAHELPVEFVDSFAQCNQVGTRTVRHGADDNDTAPITCSRPSTGDRKRRTGALAGTVGSSIVARGAGACMFGPCWACPLAMFGSVRRVVRCGCRWVGRWRVIRR